MNAIAFLMLMVAGVSAFVPPKVMSSISPKSSTSLKVIGIPRDELPGVFYSKYFDPLNLSSGISERSLKLWREAELKHGRLAMLAAPAFIVEEVWHPLFYKGKLIGAPIYYFQEMQSIPGFVTAFLCFIAVVELVSISKYWYTDSKNGLSYTYDNTLPGDLSFDPLGLSPDKGLEPSTYNQVNEQMKVMMSKELNNGRTAMIGTAGMVAQMLVDHRGIVEHLNEFGLGPAGPR